MSKQPRWRTDEPVDFVVIGTGAGGGVMARELSRNGFSVVALEQGPHRLASNFNHDELAVFMDNELTMDLEQYPQMFAAGPEQPFVAARNGFGLPPAFYSRGVGGSTVHFSGNYWRMRPLDFKECSLLGPISGTGFSDWPISYEELEPYYTRVEWEVGVSGEPGPFDAPRSKPYPMPPMPIKSSGALLRKGALALGLTPQSAPLAILSQPHNGRPPCVHCGFCIGFGCEVNAKSSSLATMIPEALATGQCELRAQCQVVRLEHDRHGRLNRVVYRDQNGVEQGQRAKAVVLSANGAETPRLLLMSASGRFPHGLANGSGIVGQYLMFNYHATAQAHFEHPLNEYKSVQCTQLVMDFYDNDEKRGFYGGGGIDSRPLVNSFPALFALQGLPPGSPTWGREYKQLLEERFTRNMTVMCNSTSLAVPTNRVTLDPEVRDRWGQPALRITYRDHDDDMATGKYLQGKALEMMDAAGAKVSWGDPIVPQTAGAHLLGTCRMGDDAATSVVDRFHRTHDVPNLFICDGSSFVTSGRGQPTMTIQALAFRAAEHITRVARAGEI